MRSTTGLALLLSGTLALAAGIKDSSVPAACGTVCRPLVTLSNLCTENDSTSSDCICKNTSFDVRALGSMCAICIQQTNQATDNFRSISEACSFTQGAYNQISASSVAATVVVTATRPGSNSVVTVTAATETSGATGTAAGARPSSAAAAAALGAVRTAGMTAWGLAAVGGVGMIL